MPNPFLDIMRHVKDAEDTASVRKFFWATRCKYIKYLGNVGVLSAMVHFMKDQCRISWQKKDKHWGASH